MAHAAYRSSPEEACSLTKLKVRNMIHWAPETGRLMPAHYLAVCPLEREVVWAVRGTQDLKDLLTDVCSKSHPYAGGYAHWGMVHAAKHLLSQRIRFVSQVLLRHPGYQLTLVGHSMGAGIAALVAHRLTSLPSLQSHLPRSTRVRCIGFATPGTVSRALGEACREHTMTVALQHDCVPRFSVAHVRQLREELKGIDWYSDMKKSVLDHDYVQGIADVVGNVSPAKASEAMVELGNTLLGPQYVRRVGEVLAAAGQGAGSRLQDVQSMQAVVQDWAAGLSQRLVALAPVDIKKVADEASEQLLASLQAVSKDLPTVRSVAGLLPGDMGSGKVQPGGQMAAPAQVQPSLAQQAAEASCPAPIGDGAAEHRPEEHLFPPGRILYIRRDGDQDPRMTAQHSMVEVPPGVQFTRIVLRRSLLADHRCSSYRAALEQLRSRYDMLEHGVTGGGHPWREEW